MTFDMRFVTPEILDAARYHGERLARVYAGERPETVVALAGSCYGSSHGLWGTNDIDMLMEPEAWLAQVLGDMASRAQEAADRVTFRPLVISPDALGTHFIDAILGAEVYFHEGQVWVEPLAGDLEDLRPPDLESCEVYQRALALARLTVEITRGLVYITTPVLSCAINIAINVFGQRILEAMVERPQVARQALGVVNDTIVACARGFAEVIPASVRRGSVGENRWAPEGHGLIDGCATQLVSGRHYAEHFARLDAEVLGVYPEGGMIHICGAHTQHIEAWRGMPKLRAVQTNDRASEDLEAYFKGLREDQVLYVGPTETMTVERIVRITGGRRLVLQALLTEPIELS